jgi:ech hydrogenase subunit D
MLEETISVDLNTIIGETAKYKVNGYRFVTISCTDLDEKSFDLLYHFDKELSLKHLRLIVPKGTSVPSISPVFLAAFLVENEIQDLFGVKFHGLAVDYGQTLYLESEVRTAPLCKYTVTQSSQSTAGSEPTSGQVQ